MKNVCDSCGNLYDKAFQILMDSKEYTFDCFECAINKLAPKCEHCNNLIIGHGVETNERMFCCAHCASRMGYQNLTDRAEPPTANQ